VTTSSPSSKSRRANQDRGPHADAFDRMHQVMERFAADLKGTAAPRWRTLPAGNAYAPPAFASATYADAPGVHFACCSRFRLYRSRSWPFLHSILPHSVLGKDDWNGLPHCPTRYAPDPIFDEGREVAATGPPVPGLSWFSDRHAHQGVHAPMLRSKPQSDAATICSTSSTIQPCNDRRPSRRRSLRSLSHR
jgi:hypothetical protein